MYAREAALFGPADDARRGVAAISSDDIVFSNAVDEACAEARSGENADICAGFC